MIRAAKILALCCPFLLTNCGSNTERGIPPCNAWIFLFGNADLHLDCPSEKAIQTFKNVPK